jgi:hypothetical protein
LSGRAGAVAIWCPPRLLRALPVRLGLYASHFSAKAEVDEYLAQQADLRDQ